LFKGVTLTDVIYIGIAGALGALSRYGLGGLVQKLTGAGFPLGTLAINVLGSALIGFIMQVGLTTDIIPRPARVAVTIGFLGAFTTFSTFSYETVTYLQDGNWLSGIINIAANVGLCLLATILGMSAARAVYGGA